MKNKLPEQVLEELDANPNISSKFVEAARRATIRDEGWEKLNYGNPFAPSNYDMQGDGKDVEL